MHIDWLPFVRSFDMGRPLLLRHMRLWFKVLITLYMFDD
jgi:hypothetical protein